MRRTFLSAILIAAVAILALLSAQRLIAQSSSASRITAAIDETRLTLLRGNTHPFARTAFDHGLAPDSLPMDQMLLVLQRSPAQQAALDKLLADQQDKSSPNYHKWLTPDEFGRQFGASDSDVQKISGWLRSHGFSINNVSHGRNLVNFSGTAGQVRSAFHTEIHQYVVNNQNHWANASDPAIPTALVPVVAGIRSLHDFFPKPQHHARLAAQAGSRRSPLFTYFPTGCSNDSCAFFNVGPADFATIYNVPSSATGSGVTIAVVSASDVNSLDVTQFRGVFAMPPMTINATGNPTSCAASPCFTQIIPPGSTDPGIIGPTATTNGPEGDEDEVEAILDVEWSSGVAGMANVDLVSSADSNDSAGIDLSATYIVDNNLAPILSESYGVCEQDAETAGNAFYNSLWSQAATQGITVLVSAGDNGSAACDIQEVNGPPSQPATGGLQVNAIASTPYDVAVGGTDYNDLSNPATYFSNTNNATTGLSALSYVPETTWNDTCTNSVVYQYFSFSNAEAACNNTTVKNDGFVIPVGGSGGMSDCTVSNGSACSGGYAKPSWQVGPGVPADGKRDIPDVSLLGADGFISGSSYIDCEADYPTGVANQTVGACNLASGSFLGIGGTSVSAQAFAGVVALINQATSSRQGNANPLFYSLAAQESASACNASSPGSSCVFHDVTIGTIAMPCAKGSPNCTVNTNGDTIGVLTGYAAGTGYDLATGLGTPNVANLLGGAGKSFYISVSAPTANVSSPGSSASMTFTVNGVDGFAGSVSGFTCGNLPSGASCAFSCSQSEASCSSTSGTVTVTLSSGVTSSTVDVTVNTTAASHMAPIARPLPRVPWNGIGIASLTAVLLGGVWFLGLRRGQWKPGLAVMAFGVALAVAGCGGGNSSSSGGGGGGGGSGGTPVGNSVVTLSATSGTTTTSATFTLDVQ